MNAFRLMACVTVLTVIFAACSNDKTLTETSIPLTTTPTTTVAQSDSSDKTLTASDQATLGRDTLGKTSERPDLSAMAEPDGLLPPNAILSTEPPNGSVGVPRSLRIIKVFFLEPMHTQGTEAAITITGTVQTPSPITRDLKTVAPASYLWNTNSTVLTITLGIPWLEDRELVKVTLPRGAPTQRPDASADGHVGTPMTKISIFRAAHMIAVNLFPQAQSCVDSNHMLPPVINSTYVGDSSLNVHFRCFYRFDLSSLPTGILRIVPGSRLYLYQDKKYGNPSQLGPELVERVDYGIAIDGTDFDLAPLNLATNIVSAANFQGWASAPVHDAIWSAMQVPGKPLDLRLRFLNAPSNNGQRDAYLYSAGLVPNLKPRVTVKYETP
jgi:hypothetical protein